MSTSTNANGPNAYPTINVTPQPERIAAGGIVLLTAEPVAVQGTFTVEWKVLGPVPLSSDGTRIALLGATTVTGDEVTLAEGDQIQATLDTSPLAVGSWRVRIRLIEMVPDGEPGREAEPSVYEGESAPIQVLSRPFAAGDDVAVTMRRTAVPPTSDQALWVAIRNSTNAISFDNYNRFIEVVVCGEPPPPDPVFGRFGSKRTRRSLHKVKRHTALPFPNVDRYRLLKAATEVFLMINCGVDLGNFQQVDLEAESRRLNRQVRPEDLEAQLRAYLEQVPTGDGEFLEVLPYLGLIRQQLRDVAIVGIDDDEEEAAEICFGILADKLAHPCFLELLHSYWHEEGSLVQAMNALSWRFQNRASAPRGRDPLAGLNIDPLRPLNNLLWGWTQDEGHRLSTVRRAYEYDHHYGLVLASKPGPPVRGADSRSRFIEAFHNLLTVCSLFYLQDDNTQVIADPYGLMTALKDTHLLLTEGQHNQYGDLPWTARHEMLMHQWILARPEMRDFLPTRTMVAYPEAWMGPVEAINRLKGWSDTSVLHFRDLAVFGEQLLLAIRFGAWTQVIDPAQAANWARYWRSELQGYLHAYRAVTGVDLTNRADPSIPALHLRQRVGAYTG